MCGRYASTRSAADLAALFDAEDMTDGDLVPDYNIAPTDPAPIVHLMPDGTAALRVARWGFLPSWAPDPTGAARMINARAETVERSRTFRDAFAQRRCLVPADGWYEWRRDSSGAKNAYFMTRPEGVVFGGIWSKWGQGELARITFSIITMPAIGALTGVHDRMPLQLDAFQLVAWLAGSNLETMLTSPSSQYCSGVEIRPVSAAVGDVRKDGPELVQRVVGATAPPSTVDRAPTLF
jgi:putative SOS response-associated peptidase YedK